MSKPPEKIKPLASTAFSELMAGAKRTSDVSAPKAAKKPVSQSAPVRPKPISPQVPAPPKSVQTHKFLNRRHDRPLNGDQWAFRLDRQMSDKVNAFLKNLSDTTGISNPLNNAEMGRVAIWLLMSLIEARQLKIHTAYTGDNWYFLLVKDKTVEQILMEFLQEEIINKER
jgi:hypothetical protein